MEFRELAKGDLFRIPKKPEVWIKTNTVMKGCCDKQFNARREVNADKKTFFSDFAVIERLEDD